MTDAPKTTYMIPSFAEQNNEEHKLFGQVAQEYTLTSSVQAQLKAADELAAVLDVVTGKQWASIATMEEACEVDYALTSYRKAKEASK